jgi:hypothetical protein
MKYNRIKVGDNFIVERDHYGWALRSFYIGKDKDGQPRRRHKTTYHGTLSQTMDAIIDRQAGMEESIGDIKAMLEKASSSLTKEVGVFFT